MIQRFFVSLFLLIPFTVAAQWIAPPDVAAGAYNVSHFRKTFVLDKKPKSFLIKISADNRYRLYVNGRSLTTGPQRSDAAHWRYDSLDLAPYLHRGENLIGVTVWNQGAYAAWAQLSAQTGLWLRGPGIQTDNSWRVWRDTAYAAVIDELHIVGPYEQVNAAAYPWGWEQPDYNDRHWKQALLTNDQRHLLPRNIPFPEERWQRFLSVRRADTQVPGGFVRGDAPLTIDAHQQAKILLEQGELTTAFPQLLVSGGKGAKIKITYAEALYDSTGNKHNRNEIAGKTIRGRYDVFLPDGGEGRVFQPLYYRTFRYVELAVQTGSAVNDTRREKSVYSLSLPRKCLLPLQ
ncbi:family 78 glycoside hydrolase catalytic domain [Chitinophaga sedimenti]|uniref:family 78 glycoside hydrolase catalytic domain n=1 Tax=Chitinophaga sedimenti TaxID=2033606 RepID=UPI00200371E3|nr:family 78 glycoside hydrolase catalytic domain [Chitinophaga sedimenti]MCK7553780.1 family 78 glycoside hydrolase catalytic domain [Chitinophaga sedimenti]